MNLKEWNIIKLENLFDKTDILYDKCKRCGSTSFECRHCHSQEFYRHSDNKKKMKTNMKIIRKKGLIQLEIITKENNFFNSIR